MLYFMTNKNNDAYRNTPQFETNQALNKDMTPDVPKFNSNAMDNQGFMPLNNCSCGCHCNHDKDHNEHSDHKHKDCHCNHK